MDRQLRSPRRRFILAAIKFLVIAFALLFATTVYARGVEPRWFDLKTTNINIPGLAPAFEGYKIVQLSDLHARTGIMDLQQLERIAEIANQQQPDLIALTGDYITATGNASRSNGNGVSSLPMLARTFSLLHAKDRVVAIMGNHDRMEDISRPVERAFHTSQIKVLINAVHSIDRGGSLLNIAGVDDTFSNRADVPTTIAQLPASGTNIILAHEPDYADIAAAYARFDLQLSGHSHGGQVVLPFLPRVTPGGAHKYVRGLYSVSPKMQLYVSAGVGTTGALKARFNCRPEISVIVLHRAG